MKTDRKRSRAIKKRTQEEILENPMDEVKGEGNEKSKTERADGQSNFDYYKLSKIFLKFLKDYNLPEVVEPAVAKTKAKSSKVKRVPSKADIGEAKVQTVNKEVKGRSAVENKQAEMFENANFARNQFQNMSSWNLPEIIQHLQYCFANNLLTADQISQIDEWINEQVRHKETEQPLPTNPEETEKNFPTNCIHIKICYYIWDQKNTEIIDPTEYGRRYKESLYKVSSIAEQGAFSMEEAVSEGFK